LSKSSYPACITNPQRSCWDVSGLSFLEIFKLHWAPLLGERAAGFTWAFERLEHLFRRYYCIIETGCMRDLYRPFDFAKDGCSTLLFDRYIQHAGGVLYSVDASLRAVQYAKRFVSEQTLVAQHDSILFLRSLGVTRIDLLYLDSLDYIESNRRVAEEWHLFELTTAFKWLRPGSMVMVDDNYADGSGKGALIRKFFRAYGLEPAYAGRQLGWIMP